MNVSTLNETGRLSIWRAVSRFRWSRFGHRLRRVLKVQNRNAMREPGGPVAESREPGRPGATKLRVNRNTELGVITSVFSYRGPMRTISLLFVLFLVGCGGGAVQAPETAEAALAPEPVQEPAVIATGPWAELYAKHGDNLLNVARSEMSSVMFNVSRNELVIGFDYPMQLEDDVVSPSKELDYVALSKTLGATQVGDVPREYLMKCGTNHGGDFEVAGAKYGIYVSGGCNHVRIFDATPEAVKLLVGEEFVQYLEPCRAVEFGEYCRTETTIRLKVNSEPKRGAFLAYSQVLTPKLTEDGWLEAAVPPESKTQDMDEFVYGANRVSCTFEIPEISPMETCGLSGNPYAPSEQCLFGGGCEYHGKCTTKDGVCVATNKTCKGTYVCDQFKQCVAKNGECVEP